MLYETHVWKELCWRFLRADSEVNGFSTKKEFDLEFESLGEVQDGGRNYFFFRPDIEMPFRPGNCCLFQANAPEDMNRVTYPAFSRDREAR